MPRFVKPLGTVLLVVGAIFAGAYFWLASTEPESVASTNSAPTISELSSQFRTVGGPGDQSKAINSWIYSSLSDLGKTRKDNSAIGTLQLMDGACGHRAGLFEAIATELGLKTRRVGFFNVPIQVSHASIEVFTDAGWRFFDPTFGIYFASPDDPERPLSIVEARSAYPDIVMMSATGSGWTGRAASIRKARYGPRAIGPIALPTAPGNVIAHAVPTYMISDLVVSGAAATFFGSLVLDLDEQPSGRLEHDRLTWNRKGIPEGVRV